MKMMRKLLGLFWAVLLLSACTYPLTISLGDDLVNQGNSLPSPTPEEIDVELEGSRSEEVDPPAKSQPQEGLEESEEALPVNDENTQGSSGVINPLSGLPVQNSQDLLLPPALVSITNFPPTARPQAGLSYSPIVFELYIGDGMTRYLAIFYGDYPESSLPSGDEDLQTQISEGMSEPSIGPVRSGRLPYEYVRKLFNGFIVMASAYEKVAEQMSDYVNVFGDDNTDPNSAMIPVTALEDIARANGTQLGETSLSAMNFNVQQPEGGKDAPSLWIFYAYKNQVFWRYNTADGSYHRWQDNADGVTFIEQTDRLNGQPLTYENVVVLFAEHEVEKTYLIDIDLLYVKRGKALLFRDGRMYEIFWTTKSEEYEQTTGKLRPIRFMDAEGNPFPLKPGQTWIELVPEYTPYWETVDSEKYHQLVSGRSKGSGYWGLYFDLDD